MSHGCLHWQSDSTYVCDTVKVIEKLQYIIVIYIIIQHINGPMTGANMPTKLFFLKRLVLRNYINLIMKIY